MIGMVLNSLRGLSRGGSTCKQSEHKSPHPLFDIDANGQLIKKKHKDALIRPLTSIVSKHLEDVLDHDECFRLEVARLLATPLASVMWDGGNLLNELAATAKASNIAALRYYVRYGTAFYEIGKKLLAEYREVEATLGK